MNPNYHRSQTVSTSERQIGIENARADRDARISVAWNMADAGRITAEQLAAQITKAEQDYNSEFDRLTAE
jgi:hypothetical protein